MLAHRSDTPSYLIRVKNNKEGCIASLLEQAQKDKNVEIVNIRDALSKLSDNKDYRTTPEISEECDRTESTNSFLIRISRKRKSRRRHSRKWKKRSSSDFIGKLEKDAEAGMVKCFQVEESAKRTERQLSHHDLKKIKVITTTADDIVKPRTKWMDNGALRGHATQEQKISEGRADSSTVGLKGDAMIMLQGEYIHALEVELRRNKVSLDDQQDKMEVLVKMKDEEIARKNLSLHTLNLKVRRLEKELARKDNIIEVQGRYIGKLEEDIVVLNRQLKENSKRPHGRSKEAKILGSDYRRVSLA